MKRAGRKQSTDLCHELPAQVTEWSTSAELPLLLIDERESRLTPDGLFPPPPNRQVDWGCSPDPGARLVPIETIRCDSPCGAEATAVVRSQ
jgi:hypothetical protein